MSQTHTCPVCGRRGLLSNCASCPQCDADLTCFQALDSLSHPTATQASSAPPKRRIPWAAIALIVTAILLLLAGLSMSMKSRLSELDRQLTELKAAEQKEKKQADSIAATQSPLPPESKIHIDAKVRILDEREAAAAQQAGAAQEQHALVQEAKEATQEPVAIPQSEITEVISKEIQADTVKVESTENTPSPPPEQAAELPSAEPAAVAQEKSTDSPPIAAETNPAVPLPVIIVDIRPQQRKRRVKPTEPAALNRLPIIAQTQIAALSPQKKTFSYVVKDGENAWDIAEQFYGDRKYYPVVIEQNPHIFLDFIRQGSTVQLFTDRREAATFYQKRIAQQDGLLLWNYQVKPGETWRSIYTRFFLPRYSRMVFYGDQEIAPGKIVRIILR